MSISDLINQYPNQELVENAQALGDEIPEGIKPRINPRTLTFPGAYEFAKRFVNIPRDISSGGGITSIDDPTYLGFNLSFEIDSPLFNGATNGETEIGNKNNQSPEDSSTALSTPPSGANGESAVGYLTRIGETQRATYLRAFIQGLLKINRERPYYFQTIEGLTSAWERSINFSEDPYVGSPDGEGITIGCLEAIDLKITALFNLYKLAVYDSQYRRTIVPKNLLRFDVKIIIHEIRKFKTTQNFLGSLTNNPSRSTSEFVNQNTSQIVFKLKKCMWDPSASGNVFETVNNNEAKVATTSIKFSYCNILMNGTYSGYDVNLNESESQKPTIINDVLKGKDPSAFAESQINGVLDTAQQRARSFGESQILGNAFGLRNEALGVIDNPQALSNALNGAALNLIETNNTPGNNIGGKILPDGRQPTNGDGAEIPVRISSENILGNATDSTQRLNPSNVFGTRPSGPPPLRTSNVFE